MKRADDVKYCVCAMVDLLGFSSHLEISSYDLRTSIGAEALKRLSNLELLLNCLIQERQRHHDFYPPELHFQRINDSVFFGIDIDDLFIPDIGCTSYRGITQDQYNEIIGDAPDESTASSSVKRRIQEAAMPLAQFLGFVARFHLSLNKAESVAHFPGAKTVVSAGFRKPFTSALQQTPDHFSANFAFSNAYLAERSLHGPDFYVDDVLLQLISHSRYSNHLLRFSHVLVNKEPFDCFEDVEMQLFRPPGTYIAAPIRVELFRKSFDFRKLNPSPLSYLQNVKDLVEFLTGLREPDLSNIYCRHIFNAIKRGLSWEQAQSQNPIRSFLLNGANDLEVEVSVLNEYISLGRSPTKEERERERFDRETAGLNEEGKEELRKLLNKEVVLDAEPFKIEENVDQLLRLGEEHLTALLPLCEGNLDLLDYRELALEGCSGSGATSKETKR
jgi:hypothetical protein